jgi:hypothetical protein
MARKGNPISVRWLFGGNLLTGVFGGVILTVLIATAFFFVDPSWIAPEQAMELITETIIAVSYYVFTILKSVFSKMEDTWSDRCAPLGGTMMENETPSRSEEETSKAPHVHPTLSSDGGPSVNHHLGAAKRGVNTTPPGLERENPPPPDMGEEEFAGLEPFQEIPPLPETPPAGPSLAPEPEERGQAPSVGLNLDPSQSSCRLDGGEEGGNSSKSQKTPSCSYNEAWFQNHALEQKKKAYSQLLEKEYPSSVDGDGDLKLKAVMRDIADTNSDLHTKLLLRFGRNAPMRCGPKFNGGTTYYEDFALRIKQIMQSEGKNTRSLSDLVNLKYDLGDAKKREKILDSYFQWKKRKKR